MRSIIAFAVLSVMLLPFRLDAQWLGSLSIESGYDDNMFRNYSASSALSTDFSLSLGYFPEDADWAANYSGSLTTFSEYPERLYSTHTIGTSYALSYGDNDENTFSVVASGSFRIDQPDYELYDYSQALGYASLKHKLFDNLPLMLSYRARYRSYPNFGELSYLEHFSSLGTMMFFQTRTSIRIQADLGIKNYSSSFSSSTGGDGSGFAPESGGLTLDGGGPGGNSDGSGNRSGNGGGMNGEGSGRRGINAGGNQQGMEQGVEYLVYDEPSTSQLRTWINIGQSLAQGTGLSVRFLQRWNLAERGRAFVGGAVDFIGEEELFDDPYGYESSELSVTLTQLLPWSMKLQTGGYYIFKEYDYPSNFDYSDPEQVLRTDERMGGWVTLQKPIAGDWLLFSGLNLSLSYVYLRNQSNTSYYDYFSNALSLGIGTSF